MIEPIVTAFDPATGQLVAVPATVATAPAPQAAALPQAAVVPTASGPVVTTVVPYAFAAPQPQVGLLDVLAEALSPSTDAPEVATGAGAPVAGADAGQVVNVGYGAAAAPVAASILAYTASAAQSAVAPVRHAARTARRKGSELWAGVRDPRRVHVTQVPSRYNPHPAADNRDCGPASVLMALRMLGMRIPGIVAHAAPQRQIDRIRALAHAGASTLSTSNFDLERALSVVGAKAQELTDFEAIKQAVLSGSPVILNGNPRNPGAYGHRFSAAAMVPFNGQHWIVVSGYDEKTGQFIINDPLSKVGPVKVSEASLDAYRAGSMGIEVTR